MFTILNAEMVSPVETYVKAYPRVHFEYVQFSVSQLHHSKTVF